MDLASDVTRRHNLTAKSLNLWFLQSFSRVLAVFPEPCVWQCLVETSNGTGLHNSAYCLLVIFCTGVHFFQKKGSLSKKWQLHLSVDIGTNVIDRCWRLWFIKLVVVDSP